MLNLLGLSSEAAKEIKSKAVNQFCFLDETKMRTGDFGE